MSLVIVTLFRTPAGERDIVVASERRRMMHPAPRRSPEGVVIDKGPLEISSDDYPKSKRLGPRTCLAYVGQSGEFYKQVLTDLEGRIQKSGGSDISRIADELRSSIRDISQTPRAKQYEREWGHLEHLFFLAGGTAFNLKLYLFVSKDNFESGIEPEIKTLGQKPGGYVQIGGPDEETRAYAAELCDAYMYRPRTSDEIAAHLAGVIREVAKRSPSVNDRVDIRRLSRGFELEAAPAAGAHSSPAEAAAEVDAH